MKRMRSGFCGQVGNWALSACLLGVLPMTNGGCGSEQPSAAAADEELVGTAVLALAAAPADATCIQITAVGYRTVTRTLTVVPGASTIFQLGGLPLGQVTFSAQAFGGTCPPSGTANWVSDAPFTATLGVSPPALVTLSLVRNGSASVNLDFNDMPGSGGSASTAGTGNAGGATAGSGAGGATGSTPTEAPIGDLNVGVGFLRVPNVQGEATSKGFENWFDLTGFGLLVAAGKGEALHWTTTLRLRYQRGAPELYADAAQRTIIGPVDVWFRSTGAGGASFTPLKVTLTNATISSVVDTGASGATPTLAVTLSSTRLDLAFTALAANGAAGATVTAFWDATTNTGSGGQAPNLDFTFGAPRPTAQEVTSFRVPSEVGPGAFSDASVTAPMSAAVLQSVIAAANQTIVPTGSVQLFRPNNGGAVQLYGSYGFKNAAVHAVTLTSPSAATVAFGADGYTWSVGPEMTAFP